MPVLESNPPLARGYIELVNKCCSRVSAGDHPPTQLEQINLDGEELGELPLVDLRGLMGDDRDERAKCIAEIVRASCEWGFFQVVNHGVSPKLLSQVRSEQVKLFSASFAEKSSSGLLNNSYRWGSPTATSPDNFSWSEAFHMPLTKISDPACYGEFFSLRDLLVEYAAAMQKLARLLAGVLINNLGQEMEEFEGRIGCDESTCFLRLNRYPPCPVVLSQQGQVHGLVPHSDSDFLTILHQDQVGGLQLMKRSKWVAVSPNKDALIVNIGDLFQAWSNDLYKSVEHKVMANPKMERFSVAYFLCPSYDSLIGSSCKEPASIYRSFTFGEYRKKVQEDAKQLGHKVGLSRFLL